MAEVDVPWCLCKRGKSDGFKNIGGKENQFWVHAVCELPTRLYWENQVLSKKYEEILDEVITRIIEGNESPDGLDKGRAEVACRFIALLVNPNKPDMKLIRDQAIQRYRTRQR